MLKPRFWVVDYETIRNCIVFVAIDLYSEDRKIFIIHPLRDDRAAFFEFLDECALSKSWHLTFNGINFDCQITQFILDNRTDIMVAPVDESASRIYQFTQRVISLSYAREYLPYRESDFTIPTLDVFKLNNWDSPAKMASLKWLEFTMDWHNLEENPVTHDSFVNDWATLKELVWYCINDVRATRNIFLFQDSKKKFPTKDQVNLRFELSNRYKLGLHSASEPRLAKELFLHFLSEKLRVKKYDLKQTRTLRSEVRIGDIILPYIKFSTPEFQSVRDWYADMVLPVSELDEDYDSDTGKTKKKGPSKSIIFKGVHSDFGLGGIHGCVNPGVYVPEAGWELWSADVTSFYPRMAIVNEWGPAHLPRKEFVELYNWIFDERQKYAKGTAMNYVLKILLNSTYGLSKNRHSFLYDPLFTFQITVNGQLLLAMLHEQIGLQIPEARPVMQNTDGLEYLVPKDKVALYKKICANWERMTGLELEFAQYTKMVIRDVNNYISVDDKGKIKAKGLFEYEDLTMHKNKSNQIVPKALHAYFLKGVQPRDYLASNRNIFDYCAGSKLKGEWFFTEINTWNGNYKETRHKKLLRYYVTNRGSKLIKCNLDSRQIQLVSGKWMQRIYNQHREMPWSEYDINEAYYLKLIQSEINTVESGKRKTVKKKAAKPLALKKPVAFPTSVQLNAF